MFYGYIWYFRLHNFRKSRGLWEFFEPTMETQSQPFIKPRIGVLKSAGLLYHICRQDILINSESLANIQKTFNMHGIKTKFIRRFLKKFERNIMELKTFLIGELKRFALKIIYEI